MLFAADYTTGVQEANITQRMPAACHYVGRAKLPAVLTNFRRLFRVPFAYPTFDGFVRMW